MMERPSVKKSGVRSGPTVVRRSVDWYEKSNSSTVRKNGNDDTHRTREASAATMRG